MTKRNDPAYPTIGIQNNEESGLVGGLTKREYFAAMAMQGMLAYSHPDKERGLDLLAAQSVRVTDAILAELNKESK